ncbi:hypothetical protein L1887_34907 [Cichorium endivia]|nr:hypothetical protein L1887_34907 [Cichorium endivia]
MPTPSGMSYDNVLEVDRRLQSTEGTITTEEDGIEAEANGRRQAEASERRLAEASRWRPSLESGSDVGFDRSIDLSDEYGIAGDEDGDRHHRSRRTMRLRVVKDDARWWNRQFLDGEGFSDVGTEEVVESRQHTCGCAVVTLGVWIRRKEQATTSPPVDGGGGREECQREDK